MTDTAKESKLPASVKSMEHSKSLYVMNSVDSANLRRRSSELGLSNEGMHAYLKQLVIRRFSNSSDQNKRNENDILLSVPTPNLDEYFAYDLKGEFPQFFIRKAERELGETTENRKRAIRELKELIRKHKKNFKTDDFFLLMFLRVKKFEAPRAFRLIQNLYEFKEKIYDVTPLDVHLLRRELKTKVYTILPYRDSLGRGIYVTRMRYYNPCLGTLNEMIASNAVCILALLDDVINQVAGFVVIIDLADISFRWLQHCGIKNAKYMLFLYFSALPIRYQEVHFVNETIIFKPFTKLVMALCTKKIKERLHFHGKNMNFLHKYIPPSILPPEYGGTLKEEEIILDADEIMANRALN